MRRPVRREMEVGEEDLSLAQQSALRRKRFLDLHDQIGRGKNFFVRRNDFRASRLIVAVVKANSRPRIGLHDNLMPALDELVDSRGQQCHAKLLFLDFPRYAHCHAANIFSPLPRDKFFALTGKLE